jgi:hypothetical protein
MLPFGERILCVVFSVKMSHLAKSPHGSRRQLCCTIGINYRHRKSKLNRFHLPPMTPQRGQPRRIGASPG